MVHEFNDRRFAIGALSGAAGLAAISRLAQAGPLDPPAGPVSSTGATLSEIAQRIARTDAGVAEPGIPVQSLSGTATSLHRIVVPGRYYLTGGLQGVVGKHGIEIAADNVTLDFRGFTITGRPQSLSGVSLVSSRSGISLRGGSVTAWGGPGVDLSTGMDTLVERVNVTMSGGPGIRLGSGIAEACFVANNTGHGLDAADSSLVRNCHARSNANAGIAATSRSLIEGCVAAQNDNGITAQSHSSIRGCVATGSPQGIAVGHDCWIENSLASICQIGFRLATIESVVTGCVANFSSIGVEAGSPGNVILRNIVRATQTPYALAAGNAHGPIVVVGGAGDISSLPGASHPWANFVY